MGVILDSSVLIAAERGGESVRAILKRVQAKEGETESALSAVTIVELTHGIYRARNDTDRERRRAFTDELLRDMTVYPVTLEIAQLAGRVEGDELPTDWKNGRKVSSGKSARQPPETRKRSRKKRSLQRT